MAPHVLIVAQPKPVATKHPNVYDAPATRMTSDLRSPRLWRRSLRAVTTILECGGVSGLTQLAQHLAIPQLARNGGETIELVELGCRRQR